ncbi:MAG: SDR family oxidoreductase [Deltaproteobacteria bacterium]|nr:SDR family oxidoreductase [Deltaproteobacteria bacterium]
MTTTPPARRPRSIFRRDLFEGRVAVVTGGATGIGLAITEELVQLGARVVIASRKRERLVVAARGLARDYGAEVHPVPCNVRERADVDALFDETLARFGRVDFVVNNGGGQFPAPAEVISEKGFRAVIETNLTGTFFMCQAAANKWMLANGGKIVTIVADMWDGFPGMVHTGAARAGVVNMAKTLAVEWASRGILVNCVAPGVILSTGMHNYPPGLAERARSEIPLKRLGTVEEVSGAVLYLLSPAGDFVTGETIRVDGGGSLWGLSWPIPDPETSPPIELPRWPEQRWPDLVEDSWGEDG